MKLWDAGKNRKRILKCKAYYCFQPSPSVVQLWSRAACIAGEKEVLASQPVGAGRIALQWKCTPDLLGSGGRIAVPISTRLTP